MTRTCTLALAVILVTSLLVGGPASAGRGDSKEHNGKQHLYRDWAKVLDVTPVHESFRTVTPRRECWTERVAVERPGHHRGHDSFTPTLVGATIGGVLGREIAHKRRIRPLGTVVGALLGGSIARDIQRRHHRSHANAPPEIIEQERCEVRKEVTIEDRVVGYDVRYEYHGRTYYSRMNRNPGRRIEVALSVTAVR